jgi:hypothetical protein
MSLWTTIFLYDYTTSNSNCNGAQELGSLEGKPLDKTLQPAPSGIWQLRSLSYSMVTLLGYAKSSLASRFGGCQWVWDKKWPNARDASFIPGARR